MKGLLPGCMLLLSVFPLEAQDTAVFFEKGKQLYATGDYAGALSCFESAVTLQPQQKMLHYYAGMAELNLKQYEKAADYLRAESALDPANLQAYVMTGRAEGQLGHYDAAVAVINKAVALDAGNAKLYLERGNAELDAKRYTDALADYRRAEALNPKLELIYYKEGWCSYYLKDTAAACESWHKLQDPDDYEYNEQIGRICLRDVQK